MQRLTSDRYMLSMARQVTGTHRRT